MANFPDKFSVTLTDFDFQSTTIDWVSLKKIIDAWGRDGELAAVALAFRMWRGDQYPTAKKSDGTVVVYAQNLHHGTQDADKLTAARLVYYYRVPLFKLFNSSADVQSKMCLYRKYGMAKGAAPSPYNFPRGIMANPAASEAQIISYLICQAALVLKDTKSHKLADRNFYEQALDDLAIVGNQVWKDADQRSAIQTTVEDHFTEDEQKLIRM